MLEIVEKLEMLEIIDCWAGVQLKSCDALSTAEESEIQFIVKLCQLRQTECF